MHNEYFAFHKKASPGQCSCKALANKILSLKVVRKLMSYLLDDLLSGLLVRLLPVEDRTALLPDPDELR
jgi:hypothetical protein